MGKHFSILGDMISTLLPASADLKNRSHNKKRENQHPIHKNFIENLFFSCGFFSGQETKMWLGYMLSKLENMNTT